MSIFERIGRKTTPIAKLIWELFDNLTTPGWWIRKFHIVPEEYVPSTRAKMMYFSASAGVCIVATAGLAIEIGKIFGFVGCNPLGLAAWLTISIAASTVSDDYFRVFLTATPIAHLVNALTYASLLTMSLMHMPSAIKGLKDALSESKEILSFLKLVMKPAAVFIEEAFFLIKRAYKTVKNGIEFWKIGLSVK